MLAKHEVEITAEKSYSQFKQNLKGMKLKKDKNWLVKRIATSVSQTNELLFLCLTNLSLGN